ncbi:MAG: histidine kinase [Gracilibacter sp. BRH_c7a]|nr:MAG: histidine kinase [Gracilibacter sp. BRH_c7a]
MDISNGTFNYSELTPENLINIIFNYMGRIAYTRDLDELLVLMADMGRQLVVADRCTLWLVDQEAGELWTKVAHGIGRHTVPMDSGFVGYAIKHNQYLLIEDAYEDSRFNHTIDNQTGYRTKAVLCIPIENSEGEIIGAFQAINKVTPEGKFSLKDVAYMTLVASYSGKALESAQLVYEIEQTQKEIIYVMGDIAERRSKETGNHVKRVAEYSKLLALKIGLGENEADLINMASPMHDIGKVGIPDSILKKPGKLTTEEYEIMKTHAEAGYNLLKSSRRRIIKAAAVISHQHHERWDGKGYPQGLKGEQIHIYGRITAIADVFDALISSRCYKLPWDLDKVVQLFQNEKGKQFDPLLVDVLLQNIDDILLIKKAYTDISEDYLS